MVEPEVGGRRGRRVRGDASPLTTARALLRERQEAQSAALSEYFNCHTKVAKLEASLATVRGRENVALGRLAAATDAATAARLTGVSLHSVREAPRCIGRIVPGARLTRRLCAPLMPFKGSDDMRIGYVNYTNVDAGYIRPYRPGDRLVRSYGGEIDGGPSNLMAAAEAVFARHNRRDRCSRQRPGVPLPATKGVMRDAPARHDPVVREHRCERSVVGGFHWRQPSGAVGSRCTWSRHGRTPSRRSVGSPGWTIRREGGDECHGWMRRAAGHAYFCKHLKHRRQHRP